MTINNFLTFHGNSTDEVIIESNTAAANQVISGHLAIDAPIEITLFDKGNSNLPLGAASFLSCSITFPFWPSLGDSIISDGGTIAVNGNNFQANYEGGDGNDLAVVP